MQNGDLIMGVNGFAIERFQEAPQIDPNTGAYTLQISMQLLMQLKGRPLKLYMMRVFEKKNMPQPSAQQQAVAQQRLAVAQQQQHRQMQEEQQQRLRQQLQLQQQQQRTGQGHGWLSKLESADNDGDDDGDDDDLVFGAVDSIGLAADEVSFTTYQPPKLKIGLPHPDTVAEATSLASTAPPDIKYELKIPDATVQSGCLSSLQLESIVYASQRHEMVLSDGRSRAGFFLGDGAGVGKGRQVAGLILENHLNGRRKVGCS
jgi:hypothetical protein